MSLAGDTPTTRRISKQIDAIIDLSELGISFGDNDVPALPIQIRLCDSWRLLVDRILVADPTRINDPDFVMDTLAKLGLLVTDGSSDFAPGKQCLHAEVLIVLAQSALDRSEVDITYALCERVLELRSELKIVASLIWPVCVELAAHPSFIFASGKQKLLEYALALCPTSSLEQCMQAYRAFQKASLTGFQVDPLPPVDSLVSQLRDVSFREGDTLADGILEGTVDHLSVRALFDRLHYAISQRVFGLSANLDDMDSIWAALASVLSDKNGPLAVLCLLNLTEYQVCARVNEHPFFIDCLFSSQPSSST